MFSSYKNTFYEGGKMFQETVPSTEYKELRICCCTKMVSEKPVNDKIDQIKMGFKYKSIKTQEFLHKGKFEIHVSMLSSYRRKKSYVKQLWCKIGFPNNKHIYWIISKNKIRLEYYVPDFDNISKEYFTIEYIFPSFYKGSDHKDLKKINVIAKNEEQILLEIQKKTMNVTEKSQILAEIFDLGNKILEYLQKKNVVDETTPKEIYLFINESILLSQIQKLEYYLRNWDLLSSSLFEDIKKINKRFSY